MEASNIFLGALISIAIGIMGWEALTSMKHDKRITVLETNWNAFAISIKRDVEEIKNEITEVKKRLDIFIKGELDVLKDIARNREEN